MSLGYLARFCSFGVEEALFSKGVSLGIRALLPGSHVGLWNRFSLHVCFW